MRKLLFVVIGFIFLFSLSVSISFAEKKENPDVFNFGFLSSLSGTFAGVAETQKKAFILAVEEINENSRGGFGSTGD